MMPPRSSSPTRQQGFTLIEVMVALVIVALIAGISWRALDSTTRATEQLDQTTAETMSLVQAFDQMERDVGWRTTAEIPRQLAVVGAGPQAAAVAITPSISVLRGAQNALRIEIIRTATTPGTWQRVQWWRSGATLYRAAATPSELYPLPLPMASNAAVAVENITGFDVRALQAGRGWVPLPPPSASAQMLALEFIVTQGTPSQPSRYRRVVALK